VLISLPGLVLPLTNDFGSRAARDISDTILENQEAKDCLIPKGITSENVAQDFNISQQMQDEFAAKSFQKPLLLRKLASSEPKSFPSRP
jgi:acetyl-CoA acyltransferase 1